MMPKMGGMLRYGIPQYRLPKEVLDKELALVEKLGVEFRNNIKIGRDISLDTLNQEYDAVIAAPVHGRAQKCGLTARMPKEYSAE